MNYSLAYKILKEEQAKRRSFFMLDLVNYMKLESTT
jgi:hypothetical protein